MTGHRPIFTRIGAHIWREWPAGEAVAMGQPFATREVVPVLADLARVYVDAVWPAGRGRGGDVLPPGRKPQVSRERQDLTEPDRRPRRRLDETVAFGGWTTPPQGTLMPDFRRCTLVWGGGHALQRARERGVDPEAIEAIVRGSTDLEPGHHGRWIVWGCGGGRRIKVVVRPVSVDRCIIVTIIRTGAPCI